MTENVDEVVIGATGAELKLTFKNRATGQPLPITGGSVRLQGQSEDVQLKDIDVAGTIFDGPNGVGLWTSLGTIISLVDLGNRTFATYTLRGKFTDGSGKHDWTDEFQLRWVRPPV